VGVIVGTVLGVKASKNKNTASYALKDIKSIDQGVLGVLIEFKQKQPHL